MSKRNLLDLNLKKHMKNYESLVGDIDILSLYKDKESSFLDRIHICTNAIFSNIKEEQISGRKVGNFIKL